MAKIYKKIPKKIKNYGFSPELIEVTPDNYLFGGFTKIEDEIIQPDGQWDDSLPEDEVQRKGRLETYACTVYGTNNAIETLEKKKFNESKNNSERYGGILSNITPNLGGSPHTYAENVRKFGAIPEEKLPFSDAIQEWNQYYSPKPMTKELLDIGTEWLKQYEFKHEWINTKNINDLKESLKRSPVCVSVFAWVQNNDGLFYKPQGYSDNHWVMCYGYEEGKYWKIFDSYDQTHKKLVWNFPFGFAKKYYLKKIASTPTPQDTELAYYQKFIGRLVIRALAHGEVYRVNSSYLQKVNFLVSDIELSKIIGQSLKEKKVFLGIDEDVFARLEKVAYTMEGIKEPIAMINISSFIN